MEVTEYPLSVLFKGTMANAIVVSVDYFKVE